MRSAKCEVRSRERLENISPDLSKLVIMAEFGIFSTSAADENPVINLTKRSRQENILPPGGISTEENTHSIVIAVVENRARVVCIAKIDTAVVNKFTSK